MSTRSRTRFVHSLHQACEKGDIAAIRRLFALAEIELRTLRGLLSPQDEVRLGELLRPGYEAGASLAALGADLGRSHSYIAKVLLAAGATIRPPHRPAAATHPVDLALLREQYEGGASVAELAGLIHYSRERTRQLLVRAGAQLRINRPPHGTQLRGAERAALAARYRERYKTELLSTQSLADEDKRSYGFVYRLLTEAGTRMRPRDAPPVSSGLSP
ncbi:hypothetical protein GXW82_32070 [Streptacidiphilus sp. 4-A2]|nr:hypothetical protein [Streptacidiphilus sp. 4-A2]